MIKLYPYQQKVFNWLQYHFYHALFLEQRLGKTYITIKDILNKPISKILIVTPYSAFLAWKIALEEFEQTSIQFIEGTKKQRLNALGNLQKWNITNYQTSIKPELYSIDWDCCVLDESTYIKNPKAKMTKAFIKLGDKITYKYILTGTPGLENPLDYFCQFRFLSSGLLGKNFWEFRNKFCYQAGYKYFLTSAGRKLLSSVIAENSYILKRKDVGNFPDKIYKIITIDKSSSFKVYEKELKEHYRLVDKETIYITVMLQWYRQLCGGFVNGELIDNLKILNLDNLVKEFQNKKILIWCSFLNEINYLVKRYKAKKIDGSVPVNKRKEIVKDFNILICNPEATKFGINLSIADVSIFYSLPLSLTSQLQAEDRMVKPEKDILIYKLIRKDSIDEDILDGHRRKLSTNKLIEELSLKYCSLKLLS